MASSDSSSSSTDWTWLPNVVLDLILDKLIPFSNQVRFAAVCKPWRTVTQYKKPTRKEAWYKQPPMLLVRSRDGSGRLYSISEEKIYNCCLTVPYNKKSCGSSFGWLAKSEDDMAICLPPITQVPQVIRDEDYNTPSDQESSEDEDEDEDYNTSSDQESSDDENVFVPEFYVQRIILSDEPSLYPNNYVVAAIYSDRLKLAFIKSGDQSWTCVDKNSFPFKDVYFYKGQLYALDGYNKLIKFDINDNTTRSKSSYDGPNYEIVVPPSLNNSHKPYLVEASNGDLLLVRRLHFFDERNWLHFDITVDFKVYRLTMMHSSEGKKGEWVEINSLGDDAVFLSDSHSMCVLASDFPNCQPNSIYYTDDCYERTETTLSHEPRDIYGGLQFSGEKVWKALQLGFFPQVLCSRRLDNALVSVNFLLLCTQCQGFRILLLLCTESQAFRILK